MFVHIFSFRWKASTEDREKVDAISAIRRFEDVIPGLNSVYVGENISLNSPEYGTTGVMIFENRQHFEAYVVHREHQALLEWLRPLIEAIELDFDAGEAISN